jgi:hypothetical protein
MFSDETPVAAGIPFGRRCSKRMRQIPATAMPLCVVTYERRWNETLSHVWVDAVVEKNPPCDYPFKRRQHAGTVAPFLGDLTQVQATVWRGPQILIVRTSSSGQRDRVACKVGICRGT